VRNFGVLAGRVVAAAGILAAAALLPACSQVADYQSSYPSLFAKPDPRAEQTMTPDQVKQATGALISDRSQLSAEAQAAQAGAAASGMTSPATTGTTPSAGAARKP
jgi:hypothetical protein